MTTLCLAWFASLWIAAQPAPMLSLDVRVFRGAVEVTADTHVTVYAAGTRTNGTRMPAAAGGARLAPLPAGRYDLQLVQQRDGQVIGIAWTSLRLLEDYPGEHQRHLEVLNFEKGWGALQIRQAGRREEGRPSWTTRLLRTDGTEVARGVGGDGYEVLVAPAGTYAVEVTRADGTRTRLPAVEVRENLTYLRTF